MNLPLHKAIFAILITAFLTLPMLAGAQETPEFTLRPDNTIQSVYSVRGHRRFINRITRRNLRNAVMEAIKTEWSPKEII